MTSYQSLGERWGHSKATISRILKKFEEMTLITLVSFKGKHGSMIYLNHYLSVMFEISDVMIDKDEIAMQMKLPIHIPEEPETCVSENVKDEQISISENDSCVPVSHMKLIVQKVRRIIENTRDSVL